MVMNLGFPAVLSCCLVTKKLQVILATETETRALQDSRFRPGIRTMQHLVWSRMNGKCTDAMLACAFESAGRVSWKFLQACKWQRAPCMHAINGLQSQQRHVHATMGGPHNCCGHFYLGAPIAHGGPNHRSHVKGAGSCTIESFGRLRVCMEHTRAEACSVPAQARPQAMRAKQNPTPPILL